jgi:hypothetical protein
MESYQGVLKARLVGVTVRDMEGALHKMIFQIDVISLWLRNLKFYQKEPGHLESLLKLWRGFKLWRGLGENGGAVIDISEDLYGFILIDFMKNTVLVNTLTFCPLFSFEPAEIGWTKTETGRDYKNQETQNLVELFDAGLVKKGVTFSWDESGETHGVVNMPGYIRSSENLVDWLDRGLPEGARIVVDTSPWEFKVFFDNEYGWKNMDKAVCEMLGTGNHKDVWESLFDTDLIDGVLGEHGGTFS